LIREHDLKPVVFHSLRHCSASLKLQIGGGNIKAVQGDTGHSQSRMDTDLYAQTHNEDRRRLVQKVEEDFLNTPAGMVRPDRGNGARGTREWCSLTA